MTTNQDTEKDSPLWIDTSEYINPIMSKDELKLVKNILIKGVGLKAFAANSGIPYSTLRANLDGYVFNADIIDICVAKALDTRLRIRNNFNRLKEL